MNDSFLKRERKMLYFFILPLFEKNIKGILDIFRLGF
jgi:hypothetical protein